MTGRTDAAACAARLTLAAYLKGQAPNGAWPTRCALFCDSSVHTARQASLCGTRTEVRVSTGIRRPRCRAVMSDQALSFNWARERAASVKRAMKASNSLCQGPVWAAPSTYWNWLPA